MKKLFSILAVILIFNCSTDDDNSITEPIQDDKMPCNCYKVLEIKTLAEPTNMLPGQYQIKRQNDCGEIKEDTFVIRYEVGWWMCN